MSKSLANKLIVGISSRALFDLDASHDIFVADGVTAYADYQITHEEDILEPGCAYYLVKKFLNLTDPKTSQALAEVILLSRNSADTGLRVFNSIEEHKLNITRAVFTNGVSPHKYGVAFGTDLFLSTNHEDVINALKAGYAAATILASNKKDTDDGQLRIAFDGDAVIFSDESERVFQEYGLEAFSVNEHNAAKHPLSPGPFKGFMEALQRIQNLYSVEQCPIRTALVTARSAPAHKRVVHTLRSWGIRLDESVFLGGLAKGEFLNAFNADIFFDDQSTHCVSAVEHKITTGHVPHGVMNE